MPAPFRTFVNACLIMGLLLCFAGTVPAAEPVSVRVKGVEGEALKNVEAALVLPTGLVKEGSVDTLWLERFTLQVEQKVREALEPFGFYDAQAAIVREGDEKAGFTLQVAVTPGEPTLIEKMTVEVQGDGETDAAIKARISDLPIKQGGQLLHRRYDDAKSDLLSAARGQGYLDAAFSVNKIIVNTETHRATIHLLVETGPRYTLGDVTFEGTDLYPEKLLRRYISFKPDEIFSYDKIGKTQINFTNSGYFKTVTVVPDKDNAVDLKIPVVVKITPAPRRVLRPGVGYGTDTGFRGSLNYKDLSFLSPGNILTVEATLAQRFQGVGTAYNIPGDRDLKSYSTLQVNAQREVVNDTLSKLAAIDVSRSTGIGSRGLGTLFLKYQHEVYSAGLDESTSNLLLPGIRYLHNRYNDLIRPTKGYHYSLELRGAYEGIISDTTLVQTVVDGGSVISLPGSLLLRTRGKFGYSALKNSITTLPVSLRFFAGGDSSVRGYAYKTLGPKDASGEVIGGKNLLQWSVELERAILKEWGVSLFFDAGNAFDSFADYKMYQGGGIAAHYHTIIGSFNLALARQLNVPDPGYRIHFTVGFQM
jgi:translocation and assembly module TamA